MLVLLVIYLSVAPTTIQLPVEHGDKLSHLLAYGVLMFWFSNIYDAPTPRTMFAIAFIMLGISLEFVQRWTGYRSFEVADMMANAIGVAVGWIFAPPRMPNCLRKIENAFWGRQS